MRKVWWIGWRLMWAKKGVTAATLLALLLPTALAVILLGVRHQTEGALKKGAGDFDLVVGAKGGAMQLTLSSLYHLGMPTGNILYSDYEALLADKRIRAALPIGLGDNYAGYRIVGTEPHLLDLHKSDGQPLLELQEGQVFLAKSFQAVIGAQVAEQTGLSIGSTFHGTHGLLMVPGAEVHSEFTYTVTGILEPTGTPHDRAIYVPISAVWKVHHAEESVHQVFRGAEPVRQEVTAVLVQLESAGLRLWMLDELRKQPNLMAAVPINEVLALSRLYLAPFQKLLLVVTVGVIIVSCIVLILALFQAVERRQETLLILRSLGAKRSEILSLLSLEVCALVTIGLSAGWLLGHLVVHLLAGVIYDRTGLILRAWQVVPGEIPLLLSFAALLLLLGALPVWSLYRRAAV